MFDKSNVTFRARQFTCHSLLASCDKNGRPAVVVRLAAILLLLVPSGVVFGQWGYSYHSSTLEEGVQRGFADVVRSQGMANLYNAQAAGQFESARSQYLDNQ